MSLRDKIVAAMAAIAVGPDVEVGQCQRGVGRAGQKLLTDAGFAAEAAAYWNNYGFASANAAWASAVAAGRRRTGTPQPLDIVHFEYGVYGHVGIVTGPDSFVSLTANRAGFIRDLGNGVFESSISGYAKSRALLGIATSNGNRPPLSTWIKDVLAPNERQVRSNANAFRRVSPDAGAALTPKESRLTAGSTHTITKAYLTGKSITQNGTTTDIWFEVGAYGWAWAGGFTSQSLDGIPSVIDARPKPPPVVVEPEPESDPEPEPVEPEPADPDPDPVPVEPTDPEPEEEPVAEAPVIEVPVRVKLDDESLSKLLATAPRTEPAAPVIPDRPAKVLWVGLSLIAVSAGPVVALTVLDWAHWDAVVGQQFAATITAWAGSIGVVLGLSRFAKTK